MPRINVPFIVQKQTLIQKPHVELVSGGKNYFYAVFKLCSTWDGVASIRAKFSAEGVEPIIMPLEQCGGHWECLIPWEVISDKGTFSVSIAGGDRLPTNRAYVKVRFGDNDEGSEPQPPTPDWFDSVATMCADAASAAQSVRDDADNGVFDGKDGADGKDGEDGKDGADGKNGADGKAFTYEDFTAEQLEALRGPQGEKGEKGEKGETGEKGADGKDGADGADGKDGKGLVILGYYESAELLASSVLLPEPGDAYGVGTAEPYDVYIYDGVSLSWVNNGPLQGAEGEKGADGADGKSAYEVALENGFEGTEAEWLESLKGEDGKDGADGGGSEVRLESVKGYISTSEVYDSVWGTTTLTLTDATGLEVGRNLCRAIKQSDGSYIIKSRLIEWISGNVVIIKSHLSTDYADGMTEPYTIENGALFFEDSSIGAVELEMTEDSIFTAADVSGFGNIVGINSTVRGNNNSGTGVAAAIFGSENDGDGIEILIAGNSNKGRGKRSAIFGMDNVEGEDGVSAANFIRGVNNTVNGSYNDVSGSDHTVDAYVSGVRGHANNVDGNYHDVSGTGNGVSGSGNNVGGKDNNVSGQINRVSGTGNKIYNHYSNILNDVSGSGNTVIKGSGNHVKGSANTLRSGDTNDVSGIENDISGRCTSVEGWQNTQSDENSYDNHIEGVGNNIVGGSYGHIEGSNNKSNSHGCHVQGYLNECYGKYQHVGGVFAEIDYDNKYAEIIGCGDVTPGTGARKNIRTLDWEGNACYAGDVKATGFTLTNGDQIITKTYLEENYSGGGASGESGTFDWVFTGGDGSGTASTKATYNTIPLADGKTLVQCCTPAIEGGGKQMTATLPFIPAAGYTLQIPFTDSDANLYYLLIDYSSYTNMPVYALYVNVGSSNYVAWTRLKAPYIPALQFSYVAE